MMNKIPCNICKSLENIPVFLASDYITKTMHHLVKCKNCGLAFVNPQPTKDEMPKFYPEVFYYSEEPFFYDKINARLRYKELQKVIKKRTGRILDVGCGRGMLLKTFKESGWVVAGTELSSVSARYAREVMDVEVLSKNIEDCNFANDYFDVITLFHSLEHLCDPMASLNVIKKLLKSDGILIIVVPRFNSVYSNIFKDKWFHLDVPRHLFHFDDRSLERLLTTAGFDILKTKRYSLLYDSFGALQSILNFVCSEFNLLNNLNTGRVRFQDIMKSGNRRLVVDLIVSYLSQALLFPPLFLIAALLSIINIGGTLTVYVRK
ncbi:class I SAM-dependent methyltransferase [candidate division WS5 bacterium]|uniref:Class I SAM-dependent methyltransferase n=1 Tax=candidate division WS5 bacterium TaxID=2093353 RepID=A0A419DDR0_9BACT|nr:MAG: class I SAM-dependent methyltransferase [candidate division WS5 bacterium]